MVEFGDNGILPLKPIALMVNSYYLAALIVGATTLAAVLAHSQPLPVPASAIEPQAVSNQRDSAAVPVCYIQLQNGQLRDLRRLCGKTASPLPANRTQRPNVQNSLDSEENDSAPIATPIPRRIPSQTTSDVSPTPQPTLTRPSSQPASPTPVAPDTPDRPTAPSPSARPSASPTSTPHPLAIPVDDSR